MNKRYIALNNYTGQDWHVLKFLEIVALTDDQIEELEANPRFKDHEWYHEMTSLHIWHDGEMKLSVKQNGWVDYINIGNLPRDLGRVYQED